MLGFDALGRLALGQLPKSSAIVLPAAAGSCVVTGTAIAFNTTPQDSARCGGPKVAGRAAVTNRRTP